MELNLITYPITLVILLIASYADIKTREVPDWLNYSFIAVGFSINLLASVIFGNYKFLINSVVGFLAFLILGYFMFYTGQWGGGDSKAIMGIGALIGLDTSFKQFPFIISFLLNVLIVGAIYGLIWSIVVAIKNKKQFSNMFIKMLGSSNFKKVRKYIFTTIIVVGVLILLINDVAIKLPLISLLILLVMMTYLWVFIKAVEKACMIKYVNPQQLSEGDWILKDVKVDGKTITGPKELGIEKKQIRKLIKFYKVGKIKKIAVKEGIPFVPSFFIAFIVSLILLYFYPNSSGNFLLMFI